MSYEKVYVNQIVRMKSPTGVPANGFERYRMNTSKLMRSVLMSTSHETAFPDQELKRSMASRTRCNSALYVSDGALVAQGPVRIGIFSSPADGFRLLAVPR